MRDCQGRGDSGQLSGTSQRAPPPICLAKITADGSQVGWGSRSPSSPRRLRRQGDHRGMAPNLIGRTGRDRGAVAAERRRRGGTATTAASLPMRPRPSTSRCGTSRARRSGGASSTCSAAASTRSCRSSPRAMATTSGRWWRGQEVGRARPPRRQGGLGKRGNARAETTRRGVHAPDARRPGRRPGRARLRLEHQMGCHDRRASRRSRSTA
jgi:hypothetical protein